MLLGLWLSAGVAQAQTAPDTTAAKRAAPTRQLQATRLTEPINLDGKLDEAAWQAAPVATEFIENRPTPGRPEKHPTEVRILYDDAALYIGAVMHDVSQDSILRELSQRDDFANTDYFGILLDTYHDKLNGYGFYVTAAGVRLDARYSPAGGEDFNWNAVWDSRTVLRGSDWVTEIRLPYSAIRFSDQPGQVWGLNFVRQRQSTRQKFFWNEVKPEVSGFLNQWGELRGLRDIKPPLRLSLTPYVSAYVNHYPYNEQGKQNMSTTFNGGADVKWGINESFTLDATLVPDFGQVQSDNQVLNLSPFEVRYNENRQFFTEGTELFNKGGLFYSRRIGGQPLGFGGVDGQRRAGKPLADGTRRPGEAVVTNPGITQLLNATKISGRTKGGLGVGVLNAVSKAMYATLRDSTDDSERQVLTQPLTNYNIFVLDQSLKNNSYVSLINTNVTRFGSTYDANVTGGLFRLANDANKYAIDGQLNYSRRRGQVFDSKEVVDNQSGYKYNVNLRKISGNFTWRVGHGIESDRYDPNDLGILFANNSVGQSVDLNYNRYSPFWKVNNLSLDFDLDQSMLYKPLLYQDFRLHMGANTTFTSNFLSTGFDVDWAAVSHNFYEPRTQPLGEYYVQTPANTGLSGYVSTDYRKKFAYDVSGGLRRYGQDERLPGRPRRTNYDLRLSPRYRVSNQLSFRYELRWNLNQHQIGYVNGGLSADEPLDAPYLNDIVLGQRRVSTFTSTLSSAYTFNNRASFTLRVRHYTSTVQYQAFTRLLDAGAEEPIAYQRNRDNSFNAFNVDAVFSWWFRPGSQVLFVWKNAGSTYLEGSEADPAYFRNLQNTVNTPHNNSLSIKVLYYLDYLTLRRKRG